MRAPESVLVVAAHPDDEVLGCGGTMARLANEGQEVRIAILAEGMTSRYQQREQANQKRLSNLHSNAQQAADKVRAKELVLCKLPDNRLDTVPLLEVVKVVEDLIEKFSPVVDRFRASACGKFMLSRFLLQPSGRSKDWSHRSGQACSLTSARRSKPRSLHSRVTRRRQENFPIPARPKRCVQLPCAGAA